MEVRDATDILKSWQQLDYAPSFNARMFQSANSDR